MVHNMVHFTAKPQPFFTFFSQTLSALKHTLTSNRVFGLSVREKEVIYTLKNTCILFKSVSK